MSERPTDEIEYDPPTTPRDNVRELAWKIWNAGDPFRAGYHEGLAKLRENLAELLDLRKRAGELDERIVALGRVNADLGIQAVEALSDCSDLRRMVADLAGALTEYADPKNWECPRCKGHDSINCGMTRWIGPCGINDEWHGYSNALAALTPTVREIAAQVRAEAEK